MENFFTPKASLAAVLLTIAIAISFHSWEISQHSVWAGEPSYHLQLQQKNTNNIHNNEEKTPYFLNSFDRFPKIGQDIIISTIAATIYEKPTLEQIKKLNSYSQLVIFLCIAAGIFYAFRHTPYNIAGIITLLFTTDLYFLTYSGFPRSNIFSHLATFLVFYGYFRTRINSNSLPPTALYFTASLLVPARYFTTAA